VEKDASARELPGLEFLCKPAAKALAGLFAAVIDRYVHLMTSLNQVLQTASRRPELKRSALRNTPFINKTE
jgi:hypothetical protein